MLLVGGAGPDYGVFENSKSDYLNYEIAYDNVNNKNNFEDKEIGFLLLMRIGKLLNLNFFMFRIIILALCFLLIYKLVIKRYAYNYHYPILLYLLYPMIIDSEHFRNFIAMTIFLISIRYLEKKHYIIV